MSKHDVAKHTADVLNAAAETAAASTPAPPVPMMFSAVVKMADALVSMSLSSWVTLVLLSVILGWAAKKFIVDGHIVIALLLTATLLLLFDAALRVDRAPGASLILAVPLVVIGIGAHRRVTWSQ